MKHLYFVRHGLSDMNLKGIFSGRSDATLHDEGRLQAVAAGKQLKDLGIDCIVASPLKRTRQTALLIADEIGYPADKIITNDLFIERDFGPLEGKTYEPGLVHAEGVESVAEISARADLGLQFLRELDADTILVVSHGAFGRALRHAIDSSIPFHPSAGFENGKVVKLV